MTPPNEWKTISEKEIEDNQKALDMMSLASDFKNRALSHEAVANLCRKSAQIISQLQRDTKWLTISECPKDGTRILLASIRSYEGCPEFNLPSSPLQVNWGCIGYWSEKWQNWNDGVEPTGLANPNYWLPLPPPPKEKE